jgi:alcohol dehydrogenase class IV
MGVISAMKSIMGVALGASHGIGHQLGPLGVGHGETSCILLPAVCRYNISSNPERQGRVKEILLKELEVRKVLEARSLDLTADLGDILDSLFRELEMPRTLADVGFVGEENFRRLAENCVKDRWCRANPRPLTDVKQVMELLEMVS